MASEGTDLDPEVEIVARRAVAFRIYYTKDDTNKHKVDKIYHEHAKAKEPGIDVDDHFFTEKCIAEEPATPERAKLRKQCNPQGPIGFLLESLHLQAATLSKKYKVKQWNQPEIGLASGPVQQVAPSVKQMATRNRTARAEGT